MNNLSTVIRIHELKSDKFLGGGFFIDKDLIATCFHVVSNHSNLKIRISDHEFTAKLIYFIEKYDIAYLKFDELLSDIKVAPLCLMPKVSNIFKVTGSAKATPGRIAPTEIKFTGYSKDIGTNGNIYLTFDDANGITVGYSGSPVYDLSENIVGMITEISAIDRYERKANQCFATPIKVLLENKPHSAYDDLLKISHIYIKPKVYEALFKTENNDAVTVEKIIGWFEESNESEEWVKFISPIIDIRKILPSGAQKQNIANSDIFRWLVTALKSSETYNPITIKGAIKSGKSIFLSYSYLFLLHKYIQNKLKYFPVYFNIEKFKKVAANPDEFEQKTIEAFDKFIDDADHYASKCTHPICFIIDGLSDHIYFESDEIEKHIMTVIKRRQNKANDAENKYIFAIDTYHIIQVEKSCVTREQQNAEYLIYINPVIRIKIHPDKGEVIETDDFIRSFCAIFGPKLNPDNIIKNFHALDLPSVDIHFLTQFSKNLSHFRLGSGLADLYSNYGSQIIKENDLVKAAEAAFIMYYTDIEKYFSSFKENIDISTYEIIKNEKTLSDFLVADYYMANIKHYHAKKKYDIRVLNLSFTKNVSMFIVDIIQSKKLMDTFVKVADSLYQKLDNTGRASVTYLLGRCKLSHTNLINNLNNQKYIMKTKPAEDKIFELIAERAIIISKINTSNIIESHVNCIAYINMLLASHNKREINRSYHRLYYGDLTIDDFIDSGARDEIKAGFDFYLTFNRLSARIYKNFMNENIIYPMLHLELFTLCNLVQVRLQKSLVHVDNRGVSAFFFNDRYMQKRNMVVNCLLIYINNYLQKIKKHEQEIVRKYEEIEPVYQYYHLIKVKLEDYLNESKEGILAEFNPDSILINLERLFSIEKAGWKIKDHKGILSNDFMDALKKQPSFETTLEHIFSTYIIALFFLPNDITSAKNVDNLDDKDKEKYSKQKIMNIIMIHDLGESEVGDYPPHYEEIDRINEEEDSFIRKLFLHGTFEGVADTLESYRLWDNWSDKDTTILSRIKNQ